MLVATRRQVVESIEKLVRNKPEAQLLAALVSLSSEAYGFFLKEAAVYNDGSLEFAPWDSAYVLRKVDDEIKAEFDCHFPRGRLEIALRESLRAMGFSESDPKLFFVESREHIMRDGTIERGLHIVLQNDSSRIAFGSTQEFGAQLRVVIAEVNVVEDGYAGYRILFHECGHAMHFLNIVSRYPSLRMNMPVFFTEAIAKLFEALPLDAGWLAAQTSLSGPRVRRVRKLHAMKEIFFLRENVMFALSEMLMACGGTVADAQQVWQVLAATILYPACSDEDLTAAVMKYSRRVVNHPGSAMNLVLTACLAAQIRAHVAGAGGTIYIPTTRAAIEPFIRPGGSIDWQTVLMQAIGRPMDAVALAQELEQALAI